MTTATATVGNGAGVKLARKDFQSDQEVRWCPGCGDYGILTAIQLLLPETGVKPEDLVFVSGIGCAARLAVLHEHLRHALIHGRAPAVATGVALARPDLHVWVIGGDGDMLSIGGNHLIHALRRNVNIKILMFNNQIYGLTKGQYSPTSEMGKVTKSTPFGSLDHPFNPISVALGAEATFVARTHDMDRKHMTEVFRRAQRAPGRGRSSRCTRTATSSTTARSTRSSTRTPGPTCSSTSGTASRSASAPTVEMGVVMNEFGEAKIVESPTSASDRLLVHDETRRDPSLAFALSRLAEHPETPTPVGVFRAVDRPVVRGRDAASAGRRRRAQRPGRPRHAAAVGADLDGQLAPTPPAGAQSSVRNTIPDRGLGVKKVVFCGMRTRSIAAARVCATDTGLHRIAAVAAPLSTWAATPSRVVPVAPRRFGEARHDERLDDRGVGRRDRGMLAGERGRARVGVRDRERETPVVDDARARARPAIARSSASIAVGGVRAGVATSNASASRARTSMPAGVREAVDRLDVELVVDELDDEHHDRLGAADAAPAARSSSR